MNRPSLGSALAVAVGYMVLVIVFSLFTGVPYTEIGDTTGNLVRALLVPLGILSALLAALTTWRGWWGAVLRDDRPAPR